MLIGMIAAVSSCTPSRLIKATTDYGDISRAAAGELGAAPSLVAEICQQRAALEYITVRVVAPQRVPDTFTQFYRTTPAPINLPGAPTVTWQQHCDAYRVADRAFELALSSVGEYGVALRALAAEDESYDTATTDLAANVAGGVAAISTTAAPYKAALTGIGAPLGLIADAVKEKWKAKQLRTLVVRTDKPLHEVLSKLGDYVRIVRRRQLVDLREALATLHEELERVREAQAPGQQPPALKVDLVSGMMIDIELTDRMARLDRKLRSMSEVLDSLAKAHTELKDGWNRGEEHGLATIKAIGKLGKAIYADVDAFRNPEVTP